MGRPKQEIVVRKLTNALLMQDTISEAYGRPSKQELLSAYKAEHSIIRTQLFEIVMRNIPTKCSVHFTRHSQTGQYHLVGSNREDWTGKNDSDTNRNTPVNHTMILNAQHLIEMSRKRLCYKAERDTRFIMEDIKNEVSKVDKDLATMMVPNCIYRGGICPEPKSCGYNHSKSSEVEFYNYPLMCTRLEIN